MSRNDTDNGVLFLVIFVFLAAAGLVFVIVTQTHYIEDLQRRVGQLESERR